MEKETKFYNGRLYMVQNNGDLHIVPFGMDDARMKPVQGELDVIEIDGQKYVTRDNRHLQKMTPELEEQVNSRGDLDDIINMNTDNSTRTEETREIDINAR